MIAVRCGCGRKFDVEERHAGKELRCPTCGNFQRVAGVANKLQVTYSPQETGWLRAKFIPAPLTPPPVEAVAARRGPWVLSPTRRVLLATLKWMMLAATGLWLAGLAGAFFFVYWQVTSDPFVPESREGLTIALGTALGWLVATVVYGVSMTALWVGRLVLRPD